MYYCFYKKSLSFKWGALYSLVKPHLLQKFPTEQKAEEYLNTHVPDDIKPHLMITRGFDL